MVRDDLPFGVKIAQTIHAAGESALFLETQQELDGTHAVALAAKNEEELLRLEAKLKARGVPFRAIREPDPPYLGQLMAIGVQPLQRDTVRRLMSSLPLVK